MLKTAMYLNVFLILGLSIAALVLTFRKKSDLKKIALLTMVFTTLNFYSFCLLGMEIVDTGWDIIVLGPVSLVTLIINIVTTVLSFVKMIKAGRCKKAIFAFFATPLLAAGLLIVVPFGFNHLAVAVLVIVAEILLCKVIKKSEEKDKLAVLKFVAPILAPILIFVIPFSYELYVLNNCDYVIRYNYQSGWIQSDDYFVAVTNNKPVEVTLQKIPFEREFVEVNSRYCSSISEYNTDAIIEKAKNSYFEVDNATIDSVMDGYVIVTLEKDGQLVSKGFYYDQEVDDAVENLHIIGDLEEIKYYK